MEERTRGRIREAGRILTAWYAANKRNLPWRTTGDPYAVWVSEVMLQQTRVDTVIGYYLRFMDAFPTVAALAEAPPERVLKVWEGLGYYSRAANLQKGARFVVERLGGALPPDREALEQIPGIGPYSAGAIASIAFGLPEPAVDGNVLRVVARFMRIGERVDSAPVRARIRGVVREMIPEGKSACFCQALMELGALVCMPGAPQCAACPLEARCLARLEGVECELPRRAAKKPPAEQPRIVAVVERGGLLLIRRRAGEGLLAGLWEFPGWDEDGGDDREAIRTKLRQWGMIPDAIERIGDSRHVFTHRIWRMRGWRVRVPDAPPPGREERWIRPEELNNFPFPAAMRYFIDWAEHTIR